MAQQQTLDGYKLGAWRKYPAQDAVMVVNGFLIRCLFPDFVDLSSQDTFLLIDLAQFAKKYLTFMLSIQFSGVLRSPQW